MSVSGGSRCLQEHKGMECKGPSLFKGDRWSKSTQGTTASNSPNLLGVDWLPGQNAPKIPRKYRTESSSANGAE